MGDTQPGDKVFDEHGRTTEVLSVSPDVHGRECFEALFSDGWMLAADAEQLWVTETRADRKRLSANYLSRYPERFAGTEAERETVARLIRSDHQQHVTRAGLTRELGWTGRKAYERVMRASWQCEPVGKQGREWLYARLDVLGALDEMLGKRGAGSVRGASRSVTTRQMASTLTVGDHRNHGVLIAPPLALPDADLPLAPRLLGLWLGDGASKGAQFTTADRVLVEEFRVAGYHVKPVSEHGQPSKLSYAIRAEDPARYPAPCQGCGKIIEPGPTRRWFCSMECGRRHGGRQDLWWARQRVCECGNAVSPRSWGTKCRACQTHGSLHHQLRDLGLIGNKHIPVPYLRASISQRRELLSGLLDTDGTVGASGETQYDSTSARLSTDVHELVCSLGYRATIREGRSKLRGRDCGPRWTVAFTTREDVFRLERKRKAQVARLSEANGSRTRLRYVVDVRGASARTMTRIRVANPSGLFLAGRGLVITHDSRIPDSG